MGKQAGLQAIVVAWPIKPALVGVDGVAPYEIVEITDGVVANRHPTELNVSRRESGGDQPAMELREDR